MNQPSTQLVIFWDGPHGSSRLLVSQRAMNAMPRDLYWRLVAILKELAEYEEGEGVAMPFKNFAQMQAMFAKGGKSAKTAAKWVKKYGVPKSGKKGKKGKGS